MDTDPHGSEPGSGHDPAPGNGAGHGAPRTPFGPRTVSWWRLRLAVRIAGLLAVLLAFALVPGLFKPGGPWLLYPIAVIAVLAVPAVVVLPRKWSELNRWEITDRAVYVRTGWLWRERKVAPLNRIQTVDTGYGPLQHHLGLRTLTVTTAATKADLKLEGLERGEAERLLAQLTSRPGITAAAPPASD